MGNPAQGRAGRAVVARSAFPTTNFAEITAANENDPDSQPGEGPLGPGNPPNQDDESSVTVTLSADLSLTKVESAGDYIAGNLPAGEFRVDVVQSTLPSGAANVVDPDGANDSTSRLALAGGASNLDQNFGYTLPAAASPRASRCRSRGLRWPGERPCSG